MSRAVANDTNAGRVHILGLPIDVVTMERCLSRITEFIHSGQPHLIITADASGLVQAQTDQDLKELYLTADLITPDSVGVLWAAKRSGQELPERVSGVDIVDQVCKKSVETGWRIYFAGAAPGIADEAAEKMRERHPGCNIVGTRHGYFPADKDLEVAKEIAQTKPDVLFVAMGIPRQEKFIRATQAIIGSKVALGVGGSFDVFSGRVKRAPITFQKMKLEWLWRLLQNPKKISKVMLLPRFVALVLKEKK